MTFEEGELTLTELLTNRPELYIDKVSVIELRDEQNNHFATIYSDNDKILKLIGHLFVGNWFVTNDTECQVIYIKLYI